VHQLVDKLNFDNIKMCGTNVTKMSCLWFRASLIYINCPMRCNTKQSIFLQVHYMFWVSATPIIRSTQNWNYSLRYCAATSLQHGQASLDILEGGSWLVPEVVVTVLCTPDDGCGWHPKHVEWTCRKIDCFVLYLVGQLLI